MKRYYLFLAVVLVLGLAACTVTPNESPEPSMEAEASPTPTVTPTAAPEPTPTPFVVLEADVPPGEYAPWQEAYADFLRQLRQEEGELRNWVRNATLEELEADPDRANASGDVSDSYSLYDVDKDGIPELFVKYGNCEAAYHTTCYAFRNGQVEAAGDLGSGHAMLCTWPGENALIFSVGHMGIGFIDKYAMVDGVLTYQEEILYEEVVNTDQSWYTSPGEVVPGSEAIPTYPSGNWWRPPEVPALLLPVYDYGSLPRQNPAPIDETEIRAAIGKVLWDGAPMYGVSGDGYYGDTGWITLEEYLQVDAAYPYGPLHITQYAWADANGDGQTDCILHLESEPDQYRNIDQCGTILSLEEDGVYAYFFRYLGTPEVTANGSVYFGVGSQLSFYKNQCYDYYSSTLTASDGLAWDEFPENP